MSAADQPIAPPTRPLTTARLFAALWDGAGPGNLPEYRRLHPRPKRSVPGRPDEFIVSMAEAAGLRGRGGAGFPMGRKLRTVASSRATPVVVVNATEGEPTSSKDQLLVTRAPHLVLDGAAWAAAAVGADRILVCVDRTDRAAVKAIRAAAGERSRLEPNATPIEVYGTPPRYVVGEETALVHWLNGGDAKPTMTPPRPFERGVDGRPTLINNAETIAHLALIAQFGPTWFRELGRPDEPGTCLLTVAGAVQNPRVIEIAIGTSLADVLAAVGGVTGSVAAVLVGGYFGAWIPASAVGTVAVSNAGFAPYGAALGCGALFVLPSSACGVLESARVLEWFSSQTAGQCGPCVHGVGALAAGMRARLAPRHERADQLERWASEVEGRGACALPDGAARFLRSSLSVFATHLEEHRVGRRCTASTQPPMLPAPRQQGASEWR